MAQPEKTVFISYRRKDISWALAVYQYLTSQKYDVFFDYTSIPSGDFEQIIISNIRARAHFILILTPTALDRCNEPGDWLRREIEIAIDEKRNIIPLFFDGFNFGLHSVAEKLTGKLGAIKRYNGIDIYAGYFMEAMERLHDRYLNVLLDAVIHPVSIEVQKVVKEQQEAADNAIYSEEKNEVNARIDNGVQEDISKVEKTPSEISIAGKNFIQNINPKLISIGSVIVLGLLLLFFGGNYIMQNLPASKLPVATESTTISPFESPTNKPTITITFTPTPTEAPLPTSTPGVGSTMISEKDNMVMVYVPAGEFKMGSNADVGLAECQKEVRNGCQRDKFTDEEPIHTVYLDAFWIDQTEVTNRTYSICVQDGRCNEPPSDSNYLDLGITDHPVVNVIWADADSYCSWTGRRLPTEAEWEKAASWNEEKQDKNIYPWGDVIDCSYANYFYGSKHCVGTTSAVGSYPKGASPYNAFDMAGNVWEWVNDWYQEDYYAILGTFASNPQGPANGKFRTLRGGAWYSFGFDARAAVRYRSDPTVPTGSFGFRCALSANK